MGGKIDAYLDCMSLYSYYAILTILRNKDILASHGVEVELHPIFLGGVMEGSNNKPFWTHPVKAAYNKYEGRRAKKYFGTPKVRIPPFFPVSSLLPQRCMVYVKEHFPSKFESTFLELWIAMWEQHVDLSKPDKLAEVLSRHFSSAEVQEIIQAAGTDDCKKKLLDNTQKVSKMGAYGAPWYWVKNDKGAEEPWFGSDRFHQMWEFLGLPWTDVTILEKSQL